MEGDSFMRTVGRMKMLLLWRRLDASSFVSSSAHCHCDTGWVVFRREILHRHVFSLDTVQF